MREFVRKKIETKREQLKRMQEDFAFNVKDIGTVTYEINAISALLVMKELKAEIRTLEEQLLYVSMYENGFNEEV